MVRVTNLRGQTLCWVVLGIACGGADRTSASPAESPPAQRATVPDAIPPDARASASLPPSPPSILDPNVQPIDLNTALRLAGVQNPDLLIARQRVVEAEAVRQLAAAQILPTLNAGMNYDTHTGVLQQSNGNILSVNRSALYVGAGANAVAAGTVNIPGIVLSGNVAQGVFAFLASRQLLRERAFASIAVRNQTLLSVATAYTELLRAEGHRAVAGQARDEAKEIARLTAHYAAAGEGRQADAERAATELAEREAAIQSAESEILTASARLAAVLNVDPSIRLHPTDAMLVPLPIVPSPISLPELIAIALLQRPELFERRAAIREALLGLESAKALPFSPTILIGFSSGGFGGGSNLVRPVFGGFGGRTDLDVVGFWTVQNLGVGYVAQIRLARTQLQVTRYQEIAVLNRVRAEVAEAFARTHARFAQIAITEQAVRSGKRGYDEDYERIQSPPEQRVLPIELLDNFRLLARARYDYLDAISDYNRAQFELFVALGQPPANMLAHTVPTSGVFPTAGGPRPSPAAP
jgi:outer membrane protein TolC